MSTIRRASTSESSDSLRILALDDHSKCESSITKSSGLPRFPGSTSSEFSYFSSLFVELLGLLSFLVSFLVAFLGSFFNESLLSGVASGSLDLIFDLLLPFGEGIGLVFSVGSLTGLVSSSIPSSLSAVRFFYALLTLAQGALLIDAQC